MSLCNWNTVLEIKQKKINLTNNDRIRLIKDKLEELSEKKVFLQAILPKEMLVFIVVVG